MVAAISVDPSPRPVAYEASSISRQRIDWARECDGIMVQFGAVAGADGYPVRHLARYRAQALIRLMVELGLHERRELVEHTDNTPKGFTWAVEYRPHPSDDLPR